MSDAAEPKLIIVCQRRGRPPLDQTAGVPSADVHLTLPATVYDRAHHIARQRRESIQDVIRRGLTRLLADERG